MYTLRWSLAYSNLCLSILWMIYEFIKVLGLSLAWRGTRVLSLICLCFRHVGSIGLWWTFLKDDSHGVSSLKSQWCQQVPTWRLSPNFLSLNKSLKYGLYPVKSNLDFRAKKSQDLCWELGQAFCSTRLSTQVLTPTLKKCCHVGIHVILGTLCEVVGANFHALNDWDCTEWHQVIWD